MLRKMLQMVLIYSINYFKKMSTILTKTKSNGTI